MKLRSTLFGLCLAACALSAAAGSPQLIVNKGIDGEFTVEFKELSRINFSKSGLEFNGSSSQTVPLSKVSTIHFDTKGEYQGIADVATSGSDIRIVVSPDKNELAIVGNTNSSNVDIYAISGVKMLSVPAYNGTRINISNLPAGIYIVKVGHQTFKFVK